MSRNNIARSSVFKASFFILALAMVAAADTPNPVGPDPHYTEQWALHNDGTQPVILFRDGFTSTVQAGVPGTDIGYAEAKAEIAQMAKAAVIVAVLDSGLDTSHIEFKGRVADGGYNFIPDPATPENPHPELNVSDPTGHGTETAGVIAANTDNAVGISGITPPTISILPLAFLGGNADPNTNTPPPYVNFAHNGKLISDIAADAIHYAIQHKAGVITMSLAWPVIADTANFRQALKDAATAGVIVIAASGNDDKDANPYPCADENVVCVGAVSNNGKMSFYSNYGAGNDVLAPGDNILSTFPMDLPPKTYRIQGYESATGTSIATPHVAALAAILKSAFPTSSLSELKARIFASAATPPTDGALFGLINIKRALEAKPQPVYYPHFKTIGTLPINEATLTVSSSIGVESLWATGNNVSAQVLINGKVVGHAQAAQLSTGQMLTVPWSYKLATLGDSSLLHMQLALSDGAGTKKLYSIDVVAARDITKMQTQTVTMPTAPLNWVGVNNGVPGTVMRQVRTYGFEAGLPKYATIVSPNADNKLQGPVIQIFDPTRTNTPNTNQLSVVGFGVVSEIFRIDVARSGHFVWAIVGAYANQGQAFLKFQFLDDNFQPAFGNFANSTWQTPLVAPFGAYDAQNNIFAINHSFADPGSWVLHGNQLVPAIITTGTLPKIDGYNPGDAQFVYFIQHLYYLNPVSQPLPVKGAQTEAVNFELRVLDNATFRDGYAKTSGYPQFNIQNTILSSNADEMAGHLRMVVQLGNDTSSPTMIYDVPSIESANVMTAPSWDFYASIGQPLYRQTLSHDGTASAFLDLYDDNARGTLNWTDSSANYNGRTDFAYSSMLDPLVSPGLLGLFELPNIGRLWIVESQFSLIAYNQVPSDTNGTKLQMTTLPVNRDSTLTSDQYAQQFAPVLMGTANAPVPGIYMDLTQVRGDLITAVTWNTSKRQLERATRYTFIVPSTCAHMPPLRVGAGVNAFSMALLCNAGDHLEYKIVTP